MKHLRLIALCWTLVFAIATLTSTQSYAESSAEEEVLSFTSLGPSGGYPEVLTFHPTTPDLVVAGGRNGGLFLSKDAGQTWKDIGASIPQGLRIGAIALDPTNDQRMAVGGSPQGSHVTGRYYLTEDGGSTWHMIGKQIKGSAPVHISFHPENPKEMVIAHRNNGAVWHSKDNGASFKSTFSDKGSIYSAHRHVSQPNVIYLGTAANGKSKNVLYVSHDGGNSFKPLLSKFPLSTGSKATSSIATHAKLPNYLYATNYGSAFISSDKGKSWKVIYDATQRTSVAMEQIIPDPLNPKRIFGTTWKGLWVSNNLGKSFKELNEDRGVFGISPFPKKASLFFNRAGQTYSSTTPGTRWKEIQPEGLALKGTKSLITIYTETTSYLLTASPTLHRLNMETLKWSTLPKSPTAVQQLLVHPNNDQQLFALCREGVWISRNGGKTWIASRSNQLDNFDVLSGTWLGEELYLASRSGIYQLNTKTGKAKLIYAEPANQIITVNDQHLMINSIRRGLMLTEDKGTNWTMAGKAAGTTKLFVDPNEPEACWALGRFGIEKYRDGKTVEFNKGLVSLDNYALTAEELKNKKPSPIIKKLYHVGAMANHGETLYAVGDTGLYQFDEQKKVWIKVATQGLNMVKANDMWIEGNALFISSASSGIFRALLP